MREAGSGAAKSADSAEAARSGKGTKSAAGRHSARKAPRRTAERILEVTLELFNRFGEPNVSTTLISAEMNISPGNLYYHYPAKDQLINGLADRYERALAEILDTADGIGNVEDAWLFMHLLFELIWQYRFLYRDLNDLLSRNRLVETHMKEIVAHSVRVAAQLCRGMVAAGEMQAKPAEIDALSANMVVVATYWLSYEFVRDPRRGGEPGDPPVIHPGRVFAAGRLLSRGGGPRSFRNRADANQGTVDPWVSSSPRRWRTTRAPIWRSVGLARAITVSTSRSRLPSSPRMPRRSRCR